MLRMYIAQQCFGLSDEGVEGAIYGSQSRLVGIDLTWESAPDATNLLKFHRQLEKHKLTVAAINAELAAKGLILKEGTVVDATIIAAPPSTKDRSGERDQEMHQTMKGNQWLFVRECASGFARPPQAASCGLRPWVDPRVRGGDSVERQKAALPMGRSPRARGRLRLSMC